MSGIEWLIGIVVLVLILILVFLVLRTNQKEARGFGGVEITAILEDLRSENIRMQRRLEQKDEEIKGLEEKLKSQARQMDEMRQEVGRLSVSNFNLNTEVLEMHKLVDSLKKQRAA